MSGPNPMRNRYEAAILHACGVLAVNGPGLSVHVRVIGGQPVGIGRYVGTPREFLHRGSHIGEGVLREMINRGLLVRSMVARWRADDGEYWVLDLADMGKRREA